MISRSRQMTMLLALLCASIAGAQASDGPPEPALDANGDGSVEYSEMRARRPDVTLKRFRALDRDDNGLISREEIEVARKQGNTDVLAIRPKTNAERNARDSGKEVQSGAEQDVGLSSEELSEVLKALDTDGDGKVSFEELRSGQARAGTDDSVPPRSPSSRSGD